MNAPPLDDAVVSGPTARWAPVAVALFAAVVQLWLMGRLDRPPWIHDESAYLLQARLFAAGRLAGEPAPIPEFFEQYHVLVEPKLAPKYLPGHALALVPGIWAGAPGLMVAVLAGVAAGLLFAVARSLAGSWVAWITSIVWLTAPGVAFWRSTYLSQGTSTTLWLAAVWMYLRWRERGGAGRLSALAALVAWALITRPWTALALGALLSAAALPEIRRRREWRALTLATAVGMLVVSIVPVWSRSTTGEWRTTPYAKYREEYIPWDRLGFGDADLASSRDLPRDMELFADSFHALHAEHTLARLPATLIRRAIEIGRTRWSRSPWRFALVPLLLVGALGKERASRWALLASAVVFAVHLPYAHPPGWTVYYQEIQVALSFVVAAGAWRALGWIDRPRRGNDESTVPRRALAAAALVALLLPLGLLDLAKVRREVAGRSLKHRRFAAMLDLTGEERVVVFVRYAPAHDPHGSYIENPPDYASARVWTARDRGADNVRLTALAPEREPYLFDEATWSLTRWTPGDEGRPAHRTKLPAPPGTAR